MLSKKLIKKVIGVSLCATIGFTAMGVGHAPLIPTASAATSYETKVNYGVNFRVSPSTSASKIRLLPRGEQIHVISKVNSYWLKIKDKNGRTGYISSSSKYTSFSSKKSDSVNGTAKSDRVIELAESYKGRVSYDYGTRNPSRLIFDCSSFTQFIFRKVGVELKWGTRQQKYQGDYVSKSNLRKGDLVFFDTIGSNNKVINHVGIYKGNGHFVHNTPSVDGITVSSLSSGWWSRHYVSARRVL
ncbi:C40 family peptidase [Cohnella sp.]|uniref:C40 family peptidase n=1 Tax=Cohnella sp. TaxID=1883426 RepID=UPI003561AFF6